MYSNPLFPRPLSSWHSGLGLTNLISILFNGHHPHFEKITALEKLGDADKSTPSSFVRDRKTNQSTVNQTREQLKYPPTGGSIDKYLILHSNKGLSYLVKMNELT